MRRMIRSCFLTSFALATFACAPAVQYSDSEIESMLPPRVLSQKQFPREVVIEFTRECLQSMGPEGKNSKLCVCMTDEMTKRFTLEDMITVATYYRSHQPVPPELMKKDSEMTAHCLRSTMN